MQFMFIIWDMKKTGKGIGKIIDMLDMISLYFEQIYTAGGSLNAVFVQSQGPESRSYLIPALAN